MKVRVYISLKDGVLDVQGAAVLRGIGHLGVEGVSDVRVGRVVELSIASDDRDQVRKVVSDLCDRVLVNTVIEKYEIVECQ